jgi:hypothetical protein
MSVASRGEIVMSNRVTLDARTTPFVSTTSPRRA